MNDNAEFVPSFLAEADALARVIALAFDATRDLTTPPQCPLGPVAPSQMTLVLEAMRRARARLRQAGVPIREEVR